MPTNRLNLDFSISSRPERVEYIKSYLDSIKFKPTELELDTIAKYILWGTDPSSGLNGRQEGLELETKHKTWDTQKIESLDALIESPNFSESMLRGPNDPPTRIPREVFSRSHTRKTAPTHILPSFESLWRKIDETELLLNYYELLHNRRKTPPRDQLLKRFNDAEISSISSKAVLLSPYKYLKLKHELVDMRREQYTLKDEYAPLLQSNLTFSYKEDAHATFGDEITVLPAGVPFSSPLFTKIFNEERYPNPEDFTEEELSELSKFLWRPAQSSPSSRFFNFCDTNHLYELFKMWDILEAESELEENSSLSCFLRAASMYRHLACFSPILDEIFNLKLEKKTNQEITEIINPKYGKNYQPNYISTLYCKKCLGEIATAAKRHREVLENCFFPENFKKCKDCGEILLRDEENFMKRHRSSDGFSPRCKRCEKIARDSKK